MNAATEAGRVITELTLQNVLRVKAVRIKPPKTEVRITGKNAQGKSSVLTGIEMVLRGRVAFPDKPVRDGEERAAGQIDLGDFVITRHINPHSLEVRAKATNEPVQRPQEFLDSLIGKYTFDPLRIMRLDGKSQLDEVKRILGVDFSKKDAEYADLYDKRRDCARDIRLLRAHIANNKDVAPVERVSVSTLVGSLELARSINKANEDVRSKLDDARQRLAALKAKKESIEAELSSVCSEIDKTIEEGTKLKASASALRDIDEAEIVSRIKTAEDVNKKADAFDNIERLKSELADKVAEHGVIESRIDALEDEKVAAIKSAESALSITGIGFDQDGGLLYNGVPLSQSSQAEQIKVCMALAMRDNPNIRVMLIREASLLDDDSMELVVDIAENNGFQVWLERVDDKSGSSFIIEDGEVVGEPTLLEE